jgi:penicillin-binding protein 2
VTFYEIGHRYGPEVLLAETRRWGFGEPTGIDLPGERAGRVPASIAESQPGEVLNLAIGQGALVSSPLQVAVAFATFANGGDIVVPRVVAAVQPGDGAAPIPVARETRGRVNVDPDVRAVITEGFWRVVNVPGGNAYNSQFEREWEVCGKTGTAENGQGGLDAWFVAFYPRSAPRFVAIAHLEGADDHGGTLAAPLIRQLIAAQMTPPAEMEATTQDLAAR